MPHRQATLGVVYLARGSDDGCFDKFDRFIRSYRKWLAGLDHTLYVLFKGFRSYADLLKAQELFGDISGKQVLLDDQSYDIGAYGAASREMVEDYSLFLNTNTSINSDGWLYKMYSGLQQTSGCVGATGSFEQLVIDGIVEVPFPNIHLRTNGFMLGLPLFRELLDGISFAGKSDLYRHEAGAASITNKILARGLSLAVVGRDGRTYSPDWWPISETFRQGLQENLLLEDNQTRMYSQSTWQQKRLFCERTWGKYLDPICGHVIGQSRPPSVGFDRSAREQTSIAARKDAISRLDMTR